MSAELTELKKELEVFEYAEKAVLTDEELDTLRTMFSVPGGFNALFRFLTTIESERGVQGIYEIENVRSTEDGVTAEQSERELETRKTTVKFIRNRLNSARNEFAQEIRGKIAEEEEKIAIAQDKAIEQAANQAQEIQGVSKNV